MSNLVKDGLDDYTNPLAALPPLAKTIAWLILSHHRLPVYPSKDYHRPPKVEEIDDWLHQQLMPVWNSTNMDSGDWREKISWMYGASRMARHYKVPNGVKGTKVCQTRFATTVIG